MLLAFLLFLSLAEAKIHQSNQLRVAVLDTGLSLPDTRFKHLCKTGHKDFTGYGLKDVNGHGTFVAGLIEKNAKNSNYCIIILKYYHSSDKGYSLTNLARAMIYAAKLKVDVVNISGGGGGESIFEKTVIQYNPKIKFIVAAGNDNVDLDKTPYYPASYKLDNIIVVGALWNKIVAPFSNYGSVVTVWEQGYNIISFLPNNQTGRMSGTSMSTAIHTGKYIYEKSRR